MPILKEEPSMYPETLLDAAPAEMADRRWLALYTKARQEKSLAREMLKQHIPFYLPLVKKTNISRGRKRISLTPLFGGYMFLFAADEVFVTSSLLGVMPVSRIDGHPYNLGANPATHALMAAYRRAERESLTPSRARR